MRQWLRRARFHLERLRPAPIREERVLRREERAWERRIAAAKRSGASRDEIAQLEHDAHTAEWFTGDELEHEHTERLLRRARRLRVPLPPRPRGDELSNEYWMEDYAYRHSLTPEGTKLVREEIRTELRWRSERRARLVLLITALTGLIGALTGLIAILS